MLGVLVALNGVMHVVLKGQWTALGDVKFVAGDGWIFVAMVSWTFYALLQKKWPSTLSATARLTSICAGGSMVLLPFAFCLLPFASCCSRAHPPGLFRPPF